MKTLITLGATNILLGFTSFVLSQHYYNTISTVNVPAKVHARIKTTDRAQNGHVTTTPVKKLIKPVRIIKKSFINRMKTKPDSVAVTFHRETGLEDYNYMQLMDKAEKLREYAEQNGYNTEYGFLVNMGMKSGKKRFFVVHLSSMVIIARGMVSHGRGKDSCTFDKTYSNEPGSNCTSLGIYKIDTCSYKLCGLQQSNSNAYERGMALNARDTVPDNEVDCPIFQSKGSPTVAPAFLTEISSIIEENEKPILMWIFDTEKESELVNCQ